MTLDAHLWYVRWFFWCCRVLDNFTGTERQSRQRVFRYQNGTNLCHFFRTLMLGSLIAAVMVVTYCVSAYAILILPFIVFPFTDIATVMAIVGGILGAVFGLAFLLLAGLPVFYEWLTDRLEKTQKPGFLALTGEYILAVKEKYCPIINFKGNDQ